MKRSDMVNKMLQIYTMYLTAGVSARETFNLMLEHMEQEGMLPPPIDPNAPWEGIDHSWEPENE